MSSNIICPNGTPETQILHAAIASWGGFIYQGICALCVAVEKLLLNPDEASKYLLNIEGYEDFTLLDDAGKILSFHQCKYYKESKSMKDEFEKMEDKRHYWTQKGKCNSGALLYFHTNVNLTYSNGVVRYAYKNGDELCFAEDVYKMLYELVSEYAIKFNIPHSSERKCDRLIATVEELVIMLDTTKKRQGGNIQQLSIDNSISFSTIRDILDQKEEQLTTEEKIRTSVFYLNLWMTDRMMNNATEHNVKVTLFLDALNRLDIINKKAFIARLFPDIDIEKGINVATEISNNPRCNFLYNVLVATENLDYDLMQWNDNGLRHSPSSLGKDITPEEYCGKIVRNKSKPPELLRDYDWIVGDIDYSVEDILKAAPNINQVNETDYNNITNTRKVGLHTTKDLNNA